jgi:TetR/AcrR family transcriptional repressor of bet genes
MGRPSLVEIRRAELLDAVVGCIATHGVSGTTVAAVAQLAGTQPSKVHHYLGSREEMIAASIDRALHNVEELVVDALHSTSDENRLDEQLEILFSPSFLDPRINQLIDHLVAASYLDTSIREGVSEMYKRFLQILLESFELAYPDVDESKRRIAAHAILALAHATPTFEWLQIDDDNINQSLVMARQIVSQLR